MIVIKRGKEPNSLLKFRKENPDADYESDMPTNVLKDIREQMWEEQKCLCAYCMKKIAAPSVMNIAGRDIHRMNRSMIKRRRWILNGCLVCVMETVLCEA